jgi:hypothetical protein
MCLSVKVNGWTGNALMRNIMSAKHQSRHPGAIHVRDTKFALSVTYFQQSCLLQQSTTFQPAHT